AVRLAATGLSPRWRSSRMLILLLAWLSFDLATPLPGAFEFEADDSEIEDSIHVRREARGRRAAGTVRVTPQARAEQQHTAKRRVTSRLLGAGRALGGEWLRFVRVGE